MTAVQPSTIALDKVIVVGTTPTELLQETGNAIRSLIMITNGTTTGQTIRLGIGKEADANSGIVIFPGGVYLESIDNNFTPTPHRITAIVDAGTCNVYVHMRILPLEGQ